MGGRICTFSIIGDSGEALVKVRIAIQSPASAKAVIQTTRNAVQGRKDLQLLFITAWTGAALWEVAHVQTLLLYRHHGKPQQDA
jgi:hypothetical protein